MVVSCDNGYYKENLQLNIVEIADNKTLVTRRYYDKNNRLVSLIEFDKEIKIPIDSISFLYNTKKELHDVVVYNYYQGKYQIDSSSQIGSQYYLSAYNYDSSGCGDFFSLKSGYVISPELKDICTIRNAVLPDGQEVQALEKISYQGNRKILEYNELNSKFTHLSKDIQSFFYNQELLEVRISIENSSLISEEYFFSNGIFTRNYLYKEDKIENVTIDVKYKDDTLQRINRHYSYR